MSIVFYVSGHGFGHASRDIEVINAVAALDPALAIHIRTSTPAWIFERTLRAPAILAPGAVDTGVVQVDSLRLDARGSLVAAREFHDGLTERAGREAAYLREVSARLVVSDVPPLAFVAAERAGVRSAALANFTWDWIYAHYDDHEREAPGLVARIRDAHAHAELAWRLPMHGGFEGFRRIVDVPLVARRARHAPDRVRRLLRLPADRTLVLVSFGGYGVSWQPGLQLRSREFGLVLTVGAHDHREAVAALAGENVWIVEEAVLYGAGLRYEDLVGAVDVVATKPGYGIISECVANGTDLLYTDRGDFAEYAVLVEAMPAMVRAEFLSHDELFGGNWDESLIRLQRRPRPPDVPATNGAAIVAAAIRDLLE
ncbi:MAG: hypothetical protein U0Q12_03545 [Vicinamibacterales bacterium]